MSTISKIQRNFQVTIPSAIRKKAHLHEGDIVDFKVTDEGILIKPQETIDRSQAWFWSKKWQEEEKKVQTDFRKGKVKVSKNVDVLLKELEKK
ncbi:MAG: AbrB/MazE/SpoVT family DNA-binding domain-containing protein [Candidatus Mariimomonas ferrooxydans]